MNDAQKPAIGLIGLGDLGTRIADLLLEQRWPVHLWARRKSSVERFAGRAILEPSLERLGEHCDIVSVCVRTDDDVREVVGSAHRGLVATMRPKSILVVHSTIAPEAVLDLNTVVEGVGVEMLDAPISMGSKDGAMTTMVGGARDTFERARDVLESFASTVLHLGPLGSGQRMKVLNNALYFSNMALAISALDVAQALGFDFGVASRALSNGSGTSPALGYLMDPERLAKACGPSGNIRKDLQHFANMVSAASCDIELLVRVAAVAKDKVFEFGGRSSALPSA